MKSYREFVAEVWDMQSYNGHAVGNHVKVHKPGDANHGKVGRILRQQTTDYGVEFPHEANKLHWFNASHLHKN